MSESKYYGGHGLRIAVGITVLVLLLTGGTEAATLVVCPSGCAFSSIQTAINASSNGDTIQVQSGTYHENVNVTKQLTLRGIDNPVVDAAGNGNVITLTAGNSTLEGFTAIESEGIWIYGPVGAGIAVNSNNNILIGNNASNNGFGIHLYSSSNNTLIGNNASNNGDGILLSSSSNNTLTGNNANSNNYGVRSGGIMGFGIYLYSSSNNTLIGNNASNNGGSNNTLIGNNASNNGGSGIHLYSSSNNTLIGNNASNSSHGIYLFDSINNTLNDNIASNNYDSGIYIYSSNNKIYNNIFNNTKNVLFDKYHSDINNWNSTKQLGTNIIGGPYLGGNFWAYPNGTGFSQTCSDVNKDGICDSTYLIGSNNIDYLPLAKYTAIRVTSPNGGETWMRGTTQTIRWTYSGTPDSRVKIELLKGGVLNRTINSSTSIGSSGSGSYNWLINSTQAPGMNYKVRVTSTANPAYTDTSNSNFTISITPEKFTLKFPLRNRNAYNATITSVFDHSMINSYSPNNTVVAYTGEKGSRTYGYSCTIPYGAIYLCGYKNSLKTNFIINGHYSGGGAPNYLYYDGHPGIDFRTTDQSINGRIPVIAAANGIAHNGSNTYNTIYIDHENGYITYYLHLYNRTIKDGNRVYAGQLIGYSGDKGSPGSPHLHFEVSKNGIPVDPYGWKDDNKDPYARSTNIELWEYQDKTPPSSITNLKNITYKPTYINWTWKDPSTPDFYKVIVYINGVFKTNISRGSQYYNLTGLMSDSYYKISTHTVDTAGNINKTWVNHTAKTQKSSISTLAMDTGLKDMIDQYAPDYYKNFWGMSLSQYKAWITLITLREAGIGRYAAHSQYGGGINGDRFNHVNAGTKFRFSTGIGAFQLDRGGDQGDANEKWGTLPTINKLDPELSLLSVLRWHRDRFGNASKWTGATLGDFSLYSAWYAVQPSNEASFASTWKSITGNTWSESKNTKLDVNFNPPTLTDPLENNVKSKGKIYWNLLGGCSNTWLISARSWDGIVMDHYYYTYNGSTGNEYWIWNDLGKEFKYRFSRHYTTTYFPYNRTGTGSIALAGTILNNAALNLTKSCT